jgi:uncharacterized protein (TIGR00268 family)
MSDNTIVMKSAMKSPAPQRRIDALVSTLEPLGSILVAFSGGVDSSLVAALAQRAVGSSALAVTAAAETLAGRELDFAREQARQIGIRHEIVTYSELDNDEFTSNPRHRCYVCQGMRMSTMTRLARERDLAVVCDGTNASDPGPDRPGLRAVVEQGVRSPLLEGGVDKQETRLLARHLELVSWDRPANACLSSRIPHGQMVTLGKLRRVESAEDLLADLGFVQYRVRHDKGTARVEVGSAEVERLTALWQEVGPRIEELGFHSVELDPSGYRSGGANS